MAKRTSTTLNVIKTALCATTLAILFACGGTPTTEVGGDSGGGGGGGGTLANPTYQVVWPARNRAPLTHGLSSALSVRITFTGAGTDGSNVTAVANREAARLASYTGSYKVGRPVKSGVVNLSATFYSGTDGGGNAVGTASGSVTVEGNLDLGTISTVGKIANVAVPETSISIEDGPTTLPFSAKDESGAIIGISAGSVRWTQTGGGNVLSLSPDGVATPASLGTATVVATVDGISSAPATITVTPAAPPAGTVRVQNGPMRVEVGVSARMTKGARTAQTFVFRNPSGSEETIPNCLVPNDVGVNDEVVILREGTQPVQGVFPDASTRFYESTAIFPPLRIPVTANGVFQATLVLRRDQREEVRAIAPITVNGLTIHSFLMGSHFSDNPQDDYFPSAFQLDLPLPGQSMRLIRGSVRHTDRVALHRQVTRVRYGERGFAEFVRTFDVNGGVQFTNAEGDDELAQGTVAIELRVAEP